jgi:hypothetical protein
MLISLHFRTRRNPPCAQRCLSALGYQRKCRVDSSQERNFQGCGVPSLPLSFVRNVGWSRLKNASNVTLGITILRPMRRPRSSPEANRESSVRSDTPKAIAASFRLSANCSCIALSNSGTRSNTSLRRRILVTRVFTLALCCTTLLFCYNK